MSQAMPPYHTGPMPPADPDFDIGRIYSEGWGTMGSRYGLLLGATVIFLAIEVAIVILVNIVELANPIGGIVLKLISTFLVDPPLAAGLFFLGVRVYRREPCSLEAMFSGFSRYGVVVGINALLAALVLAALIPGGIVIGVGAAIGAGSAAGKVVIVIGVALALAAAIFISLRLAFATVVCLDPQNGYTDVIESMALCWRATAPVAGRLLLLYLLVRLTILGTVLLLCVGVVFLGYPFGIAVAGAAYCAIFTPLHRAVDAQMPAPQSL